MDRSFASVSQRRSVSCDALGVFQRSVLVLVLLAGCGGRSVAPVSGTAAVAPDVAQPKPAEDPVPVTSASPQPTHFVALDETVALDAQTSLRVADVVIEEIAASPDDPQSYPAGSGISVTVVATRGEQELRATLTVLSAGYESHAQAVLHGYRVTLLDVEQPHLSPRVALAIARVE
jgi:hypothetical protein